MIAVDTNILVYAHRRDSPWHERAAQRIRTLAEGRASWAIPWPCLHEFMSIVTHKRIYDPPSTLPQALQQVEAWMESPTLVLLAEAGSYWQCLKVIVTDSLVWGGQIHDARIAALCLDHGVSELWTADRDFTRFPRLTSRNPLVG